MKTVELSIFLPPTFLGCSTIRGAIISSPIFSKQSKFTAILYKITMPLNQILSG